MIYIKNRLIFGLIKKIITSVFSVIYKILSVFHLQYALLVGAVGVVLWLTGVFKTTPIALTIFYLCTAVTIVLAILLTIRSLLKVGEKIVGKNPKKEDNRVATPSQPTIASPTESEVPTPAVEEKGVPETNYDKGAVNNSYYPTYYRVKQNPRYIMAEYSDRYELFYEGKYGLEKVRVDYKKA